MIKRVLFFILLAATVYAQETITVFNQRGDSTTSGQIDTSRIIDLLDEASIEYFNGLITVNVAVDSFINTGIAGIFADDSIVVWMDRYVAGLWEPSDSIYWFSPGLDTLDSVGTALTASQAATPLVAYFNPTPASTTPTSITHLSSQFVRFRKKSLNVGKHTFLLQIIPY